MIAHDLPPKPEMLRAFTNRDAGYDGIFLTAVRTTGIFCRPTCPAKKPKPENVEFYATTRDALVAGYRPCARCRPLEQPGDAPPWLRDLLAQIEHDPARRWKDADLQSLDLNANRVRRWFQANHGMTFHAYLRARRLGLALGRLKSGDDLNRAAYDHGYESPSAFRDAFQRLFGATPGRSRGADPIVVNRIVTPLGPMVAAATDKGLCLLEFGDRRMLATQIDQLQRRLRGPAAPGNHRYLTQIESELAEYFAGTRTVFTVPLLISGTEFQEQVWTALGKIPYGHTSSYEQLARTIGRPKAVRAVGRANGDNRLAIVIPCHRVIGRNGKLVGYGGGVWRKESLLALEGGRAS